MFKIEKTTIEQAISVYARFFQHVSGNNGNKQLINVGKCGCFHFKLRYSHPSSIFQYVKRRRSQTRGQNQHDDSKTDTTCRSKGLITTSSTSEFDWFDLSTRLSASTVEVLRDDKSKRDIRLVETDIPRVETHN